MANFRTSQDIKKEVLARAGELTDGTSDFDARVMEHLNNAYHSLISGGNEFGPDVDEQWIWARSKRPAVLTLLPAVEDGTVTLTKGSTVGTFSSAPTDSQEGRYLKIEARDEYFRIRTHAAGGTAFEIDQEYTEDTGTFNFRSIRLEYELSDDLVVVDSTNNKIDFQEAASTPLVAILTAGVYSTSEIATELKTQLEISGAATYTITFDSLTRKFTTVAATPTILEFLNATGANKDRAFLVKELNYSVKDLTGALTYTSEIALNAISRLIRPMTVYRDTEINTFFLEGTHLQGRRPHTAISSRGKIFSVGLATMLNNYPLVQLAQGVPDRFAETEERDNGVSSVRFNRYPDRETRIEVDYLPTPLDLQDNATSIPLVPRAYRLYLVHAATYFLMLEKSDNKASTELQLTQAKLRALVNHNRSELGITGNNYARLIPRRDRVGF